MLWRSVYLDVDLSLCHLSVLSAVTCLLFAPCLFYYNLPQRLMTAVEPTISRIEAAVNIRRRRVRKGASPQRFYIYYSITSND